MQGRQGRPICTHMRPFVSGVGAKMNEACLGLCCLGDIRGRGQTWGPGTDLGLLLGRKRPVLTSVDRTRSNRFEQLKGAGVKRKPGKAGVRRGSCPPARGFPPKRMGSVEPGVPSVLRSVKADVDASLCEEISGNRPEKARGRPEVPSGISGKGQEEGPSDELRHLPPRGHGPETRGRFWEQEWGSCPC